jgi:hypothetical protein
VPACSFLLPPNLGDLGKIDALKTLLLTECLPGAELLLGLDLVVDLLRISEYSRKLDDLNVLGAIRPIVVPANNHIHAGGIMAMCQERPAVVLKLDPNLFPPVWADPPPGKAIREASLDGFNLEIEGVVESAEEVDDAEFVNWAQGRDLNSNLSPKIRFRFGLVMAVPVSWRGTWSSYLFVEDFSRGVAQNKGEKRGQDSF